MSLDHAALVRTHRGERIGRELRELEQLFGEPLLTTGHPIREHEVDVLPAEAGPDLEERADLDRKPGLLAYLTRERVLDALLGMEVATEETPLGRAEAVTRKQNGATWVDAEPDHTDQEPRLRAIEDASLPPHRETIKEERERAHEH